MSLLSSSAAAAVVVDVVAVAVAAVVVVVEEAVSPSLKVALPFELAAFHQSRIYDIPCAFDTSLCS